MIVLFLLFILSERVLDCRISGYWNILEKSLSTYTNDSTTVNILLLGDDFSIFAFSTIFSSTSSRKIRAP